MQVYGGIWGCAGCGAPAAAAEKMSSELYHQGGMRTMTFENTPINKTVLDWFDYKNVCTYRAGAMVRATSPLLSSNMLYSETYLTN